MIYDYIIVGAGIGGLASGLNLAKNKKNVLILEKNSLPGGLATTFKRGRFEFNTSIYDLYDYGDDDHVGDLQKYLNKFNIDVHPEVIPFNTKIKYLEDKIEYDIKGNVEDWFVQIEKMVPNSIDILRSYLPILKEIHEAVECILKHEEIDERDYENFFKFIDYNAYDALKELGLSKKAINMLGYLWIDMGSSLNKLSFIDFSEFMYKLIFKKDVILKEKNLSFILKLVNSYTSLGGNINYRSLVVDINIDDKVKTVTIKNGDVYKCKNIICDLSNRYVFKDLIKKKYPLINKLENSRTLSCSNLVVYLGLNKSPQELGIKNYKYYQYLSSSSDKTLETMSSLDHRTLEVYVPNIVNEFASPKNTTIMILKTCYYQDLFKDVGNDYLKLKENLAKNIIEEFESSFNIDISTYIEEIEIATPLTFLRYTNCPCGSTYGYMRLGYDNSINRILSYQDELIDGISLVGASSIFASGIDNAFKSGIYITNELLKKESK